MGCLWTAQFLKANMKPVLLLREQRLRSLESDAPSLSIDELDGTTHHYPIQLASPETVTTPIDRLLVCTKAQDAEAAVHSIEDKLSDHCQILLMQNGMGSQQAIAHHFRSQSVWAASTTEGAWIKDFLHVCHAGHGSTWIGPIGRTPDEQAWKNLKHSLESLPFDIHFTDQIEQKLWDKLAVNCAINGLAALYDCKNGELLATQERKERLAALTREVTHVRKAVGIKTTGDLFELVQQVCRDTAMNNSSTCMDARQNRRTELAYINGFLIEQAKKLGIETPENHFLMKELAELGIQ